MRKLIKRENNGFAKDVADSVCKLLLIIAISFGKGEEQRCEGDETAESGDKKNNRYRQVNSRALINRYQVRFSSDVGVGKHYNKR